MKIKNGFMARQIVGEWVVIPVGERVADFNAIITLNETAVFIWQQLEQGIEKEALLNALTDEFDVPRDEAAADLDEFLGNLRSNGILEE